jgi:hypothetical protein
LKGYGPADTVPFRSAVWKSHLYHVARYTHGLAFFKRGPFGLEFVSPVYPILETESVPSVDRLDPFDAVLESLTAVLRADSPPSRPDNMLLTLVWDAVVRKQPGDILPVIRRAVDDQNPTVRFNAVRILFRITGWPMVSLDNFRKDEARYRSQAILVLFAAGQP